MVRVAVGMSGGVDSAVTALLLKKRKFDVVGVHMVNWDPVEEGTSNCPRTRDEADARRICDRLQIPFHSVNFVKQYWNEVFTGLIENYRRGRTTVPDIGCNQHMKFKHLHEYAINKLGADFIATGHYARTSYGCFMESITDDDKVRLLTAADPLKDQTYFLCALSQDQLKRAMFPLGNMYKSKIKEIAINEGLADIAHKPESMGICFVGKRKDFEAFMSQYIEDKPGHIVALDGTIIGEHRGIHHFTLGKRVRIRNGSHLGLFVCKIDVDANKVYVCPGSHHPHLYATEFTVENPHWIADDPLERESNTEMRCRIQRTHPPVDCIVRKNGTHLRVAPRIPLRAVASGQMCVFYREQECLGGAEVDIVTRTLDY